MAEKFVADQLPVVTTVGSPGSDANVPSEQAVREALTALPAGGHVIEDEGTPLTQRTNMNFVGAGVDAADVGGKTVVTIPGGGGGAGGSSMEITSGFSEGTIYQAAKDILVMVYNIAAAANINGSIGATSPPGTTVALEYTGHGATDSICFAVPKDYYWRVTAGGSACNIVTASLPIPAFAVNFADPVNQAVNTIYQAATDGFIWGRISGGVSYWLEADLTSPPSTFINGGDVNYPFCFLVQKDYYYRIVGNTADYLYWSGLESNTPGAFGDIPPSGSDRATGGGVDYQETVDGAVVGYANLGGGGLSVWVNPTQPVTGTPSPGSVLAHSEGGGQQGFHAHVPAGWYWRINTSVGMNYCYWLPMHQFS